MGRARLAGLRIRRPRLRGVSNFADNAAIWDAYAGNWQREDFRRASRDPDAMDNPHHIGDEWGPPGHAQECFEEFVGAHLHAGTVAGEIGPGGGRLSVLVAPRVAELVCFDSSTKMLHQLQQRLDHYENVRYISLDQPMLPCEFAGHFDLLYAFDVFVHLDLHALWSYLAEMSRCLAPGGVALIHTANLRAPLGWERFVSQSEFSIVGHYFVVPDVVRTLIEHLPLEVVKESEPDPSNFYKNRDYLVLVRRLAD